MRTHAQKRQQSPPGQSRDISRPSHAAINNRLSHPAVQLTQTIGNQAAQRLLLSGSKGAPPIVNDVLQSPGQSLAQGPRSFMEARFGHDFSRVRIHTDDKAAKSAKAINAQAYTFGQDVVFGKGKYNPQTFEGKSLLAHELTHVVHQAQRGPAIQRKAEETAPLAGTCPDNVPTEGCNDTNFKPDFVKLSVKNACETVRDTDCIKDQRLRQAVFSKFDGLKVVCKDDVMPGGECAETTPESKIINLFKTPKCPALLEMVMFHEAVHLTQENLFLHSDLAWDCQQACYPRRDPRGKKSGCAYSSGVSVVGGISLGAAMGSPTSLKGAGYYVRLYAGAGFRPQRPILSIRDVSLGLGVSFIGESKTGEIGDIPASSSTLYTVLGALRIDPGKRGGVFFPVTGGIGLAQRGDTWRVGAEVGVGVGFHWYLFDVTANAGFTYDATQKAGMKDRYTLSAALNFTL